MTPLPFRKHPGVTRNDKPASSVTSTPSAGPSHPPSSFNPPAADTAPGPNVEHNDSPSRGFARLLRRRPSLNARNSTSDDGGRDEGTPPPSTGFFGRHRPGSASGTVSPRARPGYLDTPPPENGAISLASPVFAQDGPESQKPPSAVKRSQRAEHPFFVSARRGSLDDDTDLTPAPIFHHSAGLSPTRRAMPRSPRAPRPTSRQPLTIPSHAGQGSVSDSSPTTSSSFSASKPSPAPSRPTVTAEWLSKKPTGRRVESPKSLGGAAHIRSLSGSTSQSARIRTVSLSSGASGEASTSGVDSEDGEVGIKSSRRRSQISSARDGGGSYQVEVLCVDNRNEGDEMKWEVTIRRRPIRSSEHSGSSAGDAPGEPSSAISESQSFGQVPTSPMNLSTTQSVAQAPSTASSINLSLSLDQPTGKLVFIAFPMDLHATPRRKPSRSSRAPTRSPRSADIVSPRPSTPPLPSSARPPDRPVTPTRTLDLTLGEVDTPPPAPNPNDASPPRTPPQPYHRRVSQNSLWPSPSRSGHRSPMRTGSPTRQSPAEVWTPRRTRMVSARELGGGLYAKGTVDGLSEDLERT